MLTIKEIALVLKSNLQGNRIPLKEANKLLVLAKGFSLEEYGCESLSELISELGEGLELDEDYIVVSDQLLSQIRDKDGSAIEEVPSDKFGNNANKYNVKDEEIRYLENVTNQTNSNGKPLTPPEGFDIQRFNKQMAKLILETSKTIDNEVIPLTTLGGVVKANGVELPSKLRVCLGWSPEIFNITMPTSGVYAISLTSEGRKLTGKVTVPSNPLTPVGTSPKIVSMSRYAIASFCVITPVNELLAQLAEIAEQDGWFLIDDPAEKNPYRLLLRKLELDFAFAMRDELAGKESRFRCGMLTGIYRTKFHDAQNRPILMEMEFNSQRDASTMAPWKFKRFYVQGNE